MSGVLRSPIRSPRLVAVDDISCGEPSALDRLACGNDPFTGTIVETCNSKGVRDSI